MSLRQAIDAKCKDCIFDPEGGGGTWREQIAQCSCITCPLWPVRTEPRSGPFSNPPRDPNSVTKGWLSLGAGEAKSPAPIEKIEARRTRYRRWREKNRDRSNAYARDIDRSERDDLDDPYVKRLLRAEGFMPPFSEELIRAKASILSVKRSIRGKR